MEITDIDVYALKNGLKSPWGVMVVKTDAGLSGYGEVGGLRGNSDMDAKLASVDSLSKLYGRDPRNVEGIRNTMTNMWDLSRLSLDLMSGLETACWDIKGKYYDVPVYELLGGKIRDEVPAYANGWWGGLYEPEDVARGAKAVVDAGYNALKFSPFDHAKDSISNPELNRFTERVAAVRDAIGPDPEILIEGHGRLHPSAVVTVMNEIEEYNITWFEAPVNTHLPPEAYREVKDKTSIPIADDLGAVKDKETAFRYISERAVDIIQPDVGNVGGIHTIEHIAHMADAASIFVCPHAASSPVGLMASLQLDAVLPNVLIQECFMDFAWPEWVNEAFEFELELSDGNLQIPDEPGLGISLNEERVGEFEEGLLDVPGADAGGGGIAGKQWVEGKPPGWILEQSGGI